MYLWAKVCALPPSHPGVSVCCSITLSLQWNEEAQTCSSMTSVHKARRIRSCWKNLHGLHGDLTLTPPNTCSDDWLAFHNEAPRTIRKVKKKQRSTWIICRNYQQLRRSAVRLFISGYRVSHNSNRFTRPDAWLEDSKPSFYFSRRNLSCSCSLLSHTLPQ